jgi:N-methylhydantoinase B
MAKCWRQAETIPAQLGVMSYALAGITAEIPLDQWREGDVLVCNDPYRGCTHTPISRSSRRSSPATNWSRFPRRSPITWISAASCPARLRRTNVEVFAEGLIFPPLKLISEGQAQRNRVRLHLGQRPQSARLHRRPERADRRLPHRREARARALVERYGVERFRTLSAECLDYGERYIRNALRALPRRRPPRRGADRGRRQPRRTGHG